MKDLLGTYRFIEQNRSFLKCAEIPSTDWQL